MQPTEIVEHRWSSTGGEMEIMRLVMGHNGLAFPDTEMSQ